MTTQPHSVVLLLGSANPELGEISVDDIGPQLAVGLSRGRYPKGYPHVDPNEDAALAAAADGSQLLCVADGHNGFDAAKAAIGAVAGAAGELLASATHDPERSLREAFTLAQDAVFGEVRSLSGAREDSGTTLTLCLTGPDHGAVISTGDSAAVLCERRRTRLLTAGGRFLTGHRWVDPPTPVPFAWKPGHRLVACSDGIVDHLGRKWRDRVGALSRSTGTASGVVGALIEEAFLGGAGDNVAVAVAVR